MEKSDTSTLDIEPSWQHASVSTIDAVAETIPTVLKDASCDVPLTRVSHSVQTDVDSNAVPKTKVLSARKVIISQETVDMLVKALEECTEFSPHIERLISFQKNTLMRLALVHQVELPSTNINPITSILAGRNNRVAILYGHKSHSTWCSHAEVGIYLFQTAKSASMAPLETCPNTAVLGPRQQVVIVGTCGGELLVIAFDGGNVLWQSNSMHGQQAITCLRWVSPSLLLSTGLDGRIIVSSFKGSSLEALRSVNVIISDLPKIMRGQKLIKTTGSKSRKCGIVSAASSPAGIHIASETGAIWTLDPETLTVTPDGAEFDGIEQLFYACNKKFVLLTAADHRLKIVGFHPHYTQTASFDIEVSSRSNSAVATRVVSNVVCVIDSNDHIIGLDPDTSQVRCQQSGSFVAIDVTPEDEIVTVDRNNFIFRFQLAS